MASAIVFPPSGPELFSERSNFFRLVLKVNDCAMLITHPQQSELRLNMSDSKVVLVFKASAMACPCRCDLWPSLLVSRLIRFKEVFFLLTNQLR